MITDLLKKKGIFHLYGNLEASTEKMAFLKIIFPISRNLLKKAYFTCMANWKVGLIKF